MAYSAFQTQHVSSLTTHDTGTTPSREKINFTSLSMFQTCLLAGMVAVPIWTAIALMLTR